MTGPYRPVQHYAPGGAAMVDAIERLERELEAVRRDLSAILPLIPDLPLTLVPDLRCTPNGHWAETIMEVGNGDEG